MVRIATFSLGALLLVTAGLPRDADAQIVRIGPWGGVSVRAPFVRVEVDPVGGTYVRAPFTEVQTPGRRGPVLYDGYGYSALRGQYYGGATSVEPVWSESQDTSQMSLAALHRSLVANWNTLRADLERFETGAGWQDYLQLPEGVVAASSDPSALSAIPPDELVRVLERYDEVAAAEEYRAISEVPSFGRTHRRLAAYLDRLSGTSPVPRTEELPPPVAR